ncbi:MAG: hypothetical protein NT062_35470 [Proteobacteria bacterium]|nr:hypothetical protein [Pseudomonadota bacterium]
MIGVAAAGHARDHRPGRAPTADEIRERVFATLAGREAVRGVFVQFVNRARHEPVVCVRVWLDTGAIVTIERDEGEASVVLAAAIAVAVDRAMARPEAEPAEIVGAGCW